MDGLRVWLVILLFLLHGTVGADAIGMVAEAQAHRVGYGFGAANLTVDDPAGPGGDALVVQPLSFIYARPIDQSTRLWTEAFYQEAALEATAERIGQSVRRYGLRASLVKRVPLRETLRPWLGIGLDLSQNHFTGRHLVDEEDFLLRTFPDRSAVNVGLVFNATSEWTLNRQWEVGAKLEQLFPLGNGVQSLSLSAVFLYRGSLAALAP